ncbi:YMR073C [Saccharomyces arboricola H-6]|uniref:YMR073C n=1 Tax=Saccharomyces arboricola (strain H-6 / AS 2.3317 / CBS 10644) TaxID=1160507 RepID=J8Q140_SACAR|nr:YMR073C [Saccharomyces arboricola H-6]
MNIGNTNRNGTDPKPNVRFPAPQRLNVIHPTTSSPLHMPVSRSTRKPLVRTKVKLDPGHSALDWHSLTSNPANYHTKFISLQLIQDLLDDPIFQRDNFKFSASQLRTQLLVQNIPLYKLMPPLRINREIVKRHCNGEDEFWCVLNDKVYDISSYLKFHPGGTDILLKHRKSDDMIALFNRHHQWVNYEKLLQVCFIGIVCE